MISWTQAHTKRLAKSSKTLGITAHLTDWPTIVTVRSLWKKFIDPASQSINHRDNVGGRPKIDCVSDIQAEVAIGTGSTRSIATALNTSKDTVRRRMKEDMGLKFFRRMKVHLLEEFDCSRRLAFAQEMHHRIKKAQIDPDNIFFTDGCKIEMHPYSNRQNEGSWLEPCCAY